jgi:glycogen debranching enzyme
MDRFSDLKKISESSLRENIIPTSQGTLCVAGAHQFKTLWTRDFCYAVPGLMRMGAEDVVKRQLDLIMASKNEDGLLPRGLDVVSPKLRVVNALFGEPLSKTGFLDYAQPLRAEYKGEHGTPAFDSNVLWLRSALQYVAHTGDQQWLIAHKTSIEQTMKFYKHTQDQDGLWRQPPFSDWMDSQRRTGPQLAFHILLWRTLRDYEVYGVRGELESEAILRLIRSTWFGESQTWRAESTDALLWSLEEKIGSQEELLKEIRRRPIGVPALLQPVSEVSWTTRIVGMRSYHDGYAWSWLAAETARVTRPVDPAFADQVLEELQNLVVNEGAVPEIYYPGTNKMVRMRLYRSERPFSWGSGKILEAL